MIEPHGGKLVDLILSRGEVETKNFTKLARLKINKEVVKDVKNITRGAYSLPSGFLKIGWNE